MKDAHTREQHGRIAENQSEPGEVPFDPEFRENSAAIDWKLLSSSIVFALCIAPTLVSYVPYFFKWDDSEYLWRSINVSRAFWSGHRHELINAFVSIRPPIMTLLGLPWGPLWSWDAAGKCFITLTTIMAALVACCLFLLLRIGLKPLYLAIASACVFAALGPYPSGAHAHLSATGFLVDSLFAWNAFAAMLLIPYEAATRSSSTRADLVRGVLWGLIFSLGAMTKVSFLYFILLILPILFVVRMRHSGRRSALTTLTTLGLCLSPVGIYWLRYGLPALKNGWAASFGHDAPFYHIPFSQFVSEIVRESPGMLLPVIFVIAGIVYLVVNRGEIAWGTKILPVLITVGFCTISLASSNRQLRYSFVGIIALPFLMAILLSGRARGAARRPAMFAAILAFCYIVAAGVPLLHRPARESIARSEAALAEAARVNAKRVLVATDSSTLNGNLMLVAIVLSPSRPEIETATLGWHAVAGLPIEDDFRVIRDSDLVIFQNKEALDVPFMNQRISEYEQYIRENFGDVPIKIADDFRIYRVCHNSH